MAVRYLGFYYFALLTLKSISFVSSFAPAGKAFIQTPQLKNNPASRVVTFSTNDDNQADEEGSNLMAELFRVAQSKGVSLGADDFDDGEGEDEDEEIGDDADDDDVSLDELSPSASDIPPEEVVTDTTITDDKLYSEVKERVLDTAGGFVEYVKGVSDDDDDDDEDSDDLSLAQAEDKTKPYVPPKTIPDPELTAGEVVALVLEAFRNNDNPTPNFGAEVFFGYSSPGSQVKTEEGLTPTEYAEYLKSSPDYCVLFKHTEAFIEKADYNSDGSRAYFTAGVKTGPRPLDKVMVNFILSSSVSGDNTSWLIDSMLIRPESMRRTRRR